MNEAYFEGVKGESGAEAGNRAEAGGGVWGGWQQVQGLYPRPGPGPLGSRSRERGALGGAPGGERGAGAEEPGCEPRCRGRRGGLSFPAGCRGVKAREPRELRPRRLQPPGSWKCG